VLLAELPYVLSLSIMLYWSSSELRAEQKEHQAGIWCSVCYSAPRKQLLHNPYLDSLGFYSVSV